MKTIVNNRISFNEKILTSNKLLFSLSKKRNYIGLSNLGNTCYM